MAIDNIETEKIVEVAYREGYTTGYATGWAEALQMAAALLGKIAKQRNCSDANRWLNARGEEGET